MVKIVLSRRNTENLSFSRNNSGHNTRIILSSFTSFTTHSYNMKSKQNPNCLLNCHHQHKSYARCIRFLCLNSAERWNFIKKHNICPKLNCQNCSKKTKVPCKFCQSFNHHYHLCGNMKGKQNAARISLRFQKQIAENKISKTRKLKSEPESNPNHSSYSRSPPLCQQSVDRKLAPVQKV